MSKERETPKIVSSASMLCKHRWDGGHICKGPKGHDNEHECRCGVIEVKV